MARNAVLLTSLLLSLFLLPGRSASASDARPVGQNDRWWAQRTGLSEGDIRKLRLAAGAEDGHPATWIESIDPGTLPKGHLLLVTAEGSSQCVKVGVYQRRWTGFKRVWSARQMPGGEAFCHPSPCRKPGAFARKNGEVLVVVPVPQDAPSGVCDENVIVTHRRTGKTYTFVDQQRTTAQCGRDTYQEALNAAFETFAKERLATIQILPNLSAESAIALDRTPNGTTATRIRLRRQLWSELGVMTKRQKLSECIDVARALDKTTTPLPISSKEAESFLADLNKIDLQSDECLRSRNGGCMLQKDGTSFMLVLPDGRSVSLSDTRGVRDAKSENPELSAWVYKLLGFVQD